MRRNSKPYVGIKISRLELIQPNSRFKFRKMKLKSSDTMWFGWLILDVSRVNSKSSCGIPFKALG